METHTRPTPTPILPFPVRMSGAPSTDYCRALRMYGALSATGRRTFVFTKPNAQHAADGEAYHEAA